MEFRKETFFLNAKPFIDWTKKNEEDYMKNHKRYSPLLYLPIVALKAFSVELLLKGFMTDNEGIIFENERKTHDLKKLYDCLNENDKQDIIKRLKESGYTKDIDENLEHIKEYFVDFRYFIETLEDKPDDKGNTSGGKEWNFELLNYLFVVLVEKANIK